MTNEERAEKIKRQAARHSVKSKIQTAAFDAACEAGLTEVELLGIFLDLAKDSQRELMSAESAPEEEKK